MTGVWPWLAVTGAGALHGLNPATAWALLVARDGDGPRRLPTWRTLAPVAAGHVASVAAIAALAALGLVAQRGMLPWLAGGLAVLAAGGRAAGHLPPRLHTAAGGAGLALWSFAMGIVHGTGLMLVPALVALCLSGGPAREIAASGSLALALAAVVLHLASMLAATAAMMVLARQGWHLWRRLPTRRR